MGHAFDLHNPGFWAAPSTSEGRLSSYFGRAASSALRACHSLLILFPPGSRASDRKAMNALSQLILIHMAERTEPSLL